MHKISNFTGSAARHGWDKMPSMSFGMSRSHNDLPQTAAMKRPAVASPASPAIPPGAHVNLSFNVPFQSHLPGPEADDVLYASPGAFDRWTHPAGTAEHAPNYDLPVHVQHVESLRLLCKEMTERSDGLIHADVVSSEPRPVPGFQRGPLRALITNVCLSGEVELASRMRCRILTESPISLRCSTVDIDCGLILDPSSTKVKAEFLGQLDEISRLTKADLFLLVPKQPDIETASFNGTLETVNRPQKFRCAIYGDYETAETAKTRVLILIDRILGRHVDAMRLELSMHTLICGRGRKNIKLIESLTNTAIYFPPPFPRLYGYTPPGSQRRPDDQIIITGVRVEDIMKAKKRLHDLVINTKAFHKGVVVTETKIDSIILERLDKVRKIMENNGSYVVFPSLGMQRGIVRIQGTDVLNVERTVRELMTLAGQFYSASWSITQMDPTLRMPTAEDIRAMLADICINSGAEIHLEHLNYHIYGSDDAVKAAMHVISNLGFMKTATYTLSVKIELANEHKEFVSGKKNGKINKIMSQSSVQIVFDGFNEYNFYIVVRGSQYEATKNGLDLVEQEMPAAISFHVPDQYHKRIIGIGGQHIQRIMKKYSVFVKFSNAMDRGGIGKDDDDIKVDNVICRTPARNAQNLDLVKQEIMDMVEKGDAELVQEKVVIDRLFHRELIARMPEIEGLEKKWNCKITFPSTEEASDFVQITGPEYQVPQAVDEFLGMVPESHEIAFAVSPELSEYTRSPEFQEEVVSKMKSQYVVDVRPHEIRQGTPEKVDHVIEGFVLNYTRNNAGGLKDAIDFLISRLVAHGLDATTVKGAIPRPKSDSFEESLPFFNSKLLPKTNPSIEATDSPTRSQFGEEASERPGFLDRLRKPGSMSSFSSILERRKNGSNSPGSLFKHASSNASKASLVSLESQGSGYRNPWNDSGINLPDEEPHNNGWHMPPPPSSSHSQHKFPFGMTSTGMSGDATPRYDPRASVDSGRPSTSHSASGYPAPIGPPR